MTWKEVLAAKIPPRHGREIDIFETQIELKGQGKVEDKLFAETRLRRAGSWIVSAWIDAFRIALP